MLSFCVEAKEEKKRDKKQNKTKNTRNNKEKHSYYNFIVQSINQSKIIV